jgi:hypothetical protein
MVTSVGHKKSFTEVFELNEGKDQVSLKPISLNAETKELKKWQ